MERIKAFVFPFLFFVMVAACSDDSLLFEKSFPIPETGWALDHNLEGSWMPKDPESSVSVILDVLHDRDFGYQNLYLLGQIERAGSHLWNDTFSIQLARPNSGVWLGTKNHDGILRSDTIHLPQPIPPGQALAFRISQFSREPILQGIKEIKVRFVHLPTH